MKKSRQNRFRRKQLKLPQNRFYKKCRVNFRFLHIWEIWNSSKFGKISNFSTSFVLKFWNSSTCGDILDFSYSVMYWILKFFHMTDFSPPIYRLYRWQIWGIQDLCFLFVSFRSQLHNCLLHPGVSVICFSPGQGCRIVFGAWDPIFFAWK